MTTTITGDQTGTVGLINAKTAVASTSGTSIDFTGIPAGVKRITVMFQGVSTNGTSQVLTQLGSGSVQTTSYLGAGGANGSAGNSTAGFLTGFANAPTSSSVRHGSVIFTNISGNSWVANGCFSYSDSAIAGTIAGSVTLSGTLDRVRITTVNGTDTFDAGSINILYE